MDYAFINAINYIPLIIMLLLLYDIMCQYWVNFTRRTKTAGRIQGLSHILKLRDDLMIKRGIGLFHVHGHIKECYPRYAPTFIESAGMVDGEIIETLWHILNDTASSARAMSWFHRQEYLDVHMADSNWKKLTRMGMWSYLKPRKGTYHSAVPTLSRKWKACLDQCADSAEYLTELSNHVGPIKVARWTQDLLRMQAERGKDVNVMDELDVKEPNGSSRTTLHSQSWPLIFDIALGKAEVQQTLAKQEEELNLPAGCSAWISIGLKLEEQQ